MINLLPPDMKDGYRYARRNVTLRRWVGLLLVALVGLGVLTTYGLLTLHQSTVHYNQDIAASEASLKAQHYSEVQSQIKEMSNDFKLVVKVLSQEVLFSELLKQIGTAIPTNADLTGLNISQTKGGIDITAIATDYHTATQVQVNLADPNNKIFAKADIQNVACTGTNAPDPRYPCQVNIRALFSNNNPFLFINSKAAKP